MKSSVLKLGAFIFILALIVVGVKTITTTPFFSDTETSAGNTLSVSEEFPDPYVDEVVDVTGTFGHCCDAGDLSSDPNVAEPLVTEAPDSPPATNFIQISDNSSITLKFVDNKAVPTGDTNPDIRIHVYDDLFPATATIEVSQDGTTWYSLGDFPDTANVDLNIESTGLAEVKYVKLTDLVAAGDPYPTLGFDLDAVEALSSAAE
ncbi:MAG TPA: hypothetical protein VF303_04425 [Candidatus Nanoarchaeia archaeon]